MPKREDNPSEIHPVVLDNFVKLQNVLSNLAVKLDSLTRRIDDLVTIFENAAKSLTEQDIHSDKRISKKIDLVLDQNKTIARGISILEERSRDQQPQQQVQQPQQPIQPPQFQRSQFQSQEEPRFKPKPLPRL